MSGLSNASKTALLKLIFQNINWANLGDATGLRGSTGPGNLYIALHTADPTDAGNQASSEATYTNYARAAVVRDATKWDVAGDTVANLELVPFPRAGAMGAPQQITHFSVGLASSGGGVILGVGPAPLLVSENITPEFEPGDLTAVAA